MSQDKRHHHKFLHDTVEHVEANPKELDPSLKELEKMVQNDTRLYMLFQMMFQQASRRIPPSIQDHLRPPPSFTLTSRSHQTKST
jgi:hypothetical protein